MKGNIVVNNNCFLICNSFDKLLQVFIHAG
jgi:hypothetical protein